MGLFSRFNPDSPRQLFHSSGVVGDTDGQTLGTTSAESFEQRQRVERRRRLVGGYRDAGVLHNYRKEARNGITPQRDDAKDKILHHKEYPTVLMKNIPLNRVDVVKSSRIKGSSQAESAALAQKPSNSAVSRPSFQEPLSRRYDPYR